MTKLSQRIKKRTMKSRIRNLKKNRLVDNVSNTETRSSTSTENETTNIISSIGDISTTNLSQRRIVSLQTLLDLVYLTQNHCKKCSGSNLKIVKETWKGIQCDLYLHCEFCQETMKISSDSEHNSLPVNLAMVWGTIEGGGGYQSHFDILKILDIPPMQYRCYKRHEVILNDEMEAFTTKDIINNGKEELELALQDPNTKYYDGIPGISITCDGGWGKRSYGHSFKSLSGCAVIIGNKTGKILHVGIRNKYCHLCTLSPNKTHRCFKNYNGSSSSMETDIVLQGFLESKNVHGVYYNEMLADQDSSVFVTVQEAMQQKFKVPVEKINCVNHAVKNLKKKLYKMLNQTKVYSLASRKWLRNKIDKMSIACKSAIKYNNENINCNWLLLRQDILNCPLHYIENHLCCRSYFCKRATLQVLEEVKNDQKFWKDLMEIFAQLANLSQSLIANQRSNQAEAFMSIVSKYIGGKRKNLYQKNQFQTRVYFAAKAFKKGSQSDRMMYKSSFTKSPSTVWRYKSFSEKRPRVRAYKKNVKEAGNAVLDYGQLARQPDMTTEMFDINSKDFLDERMIDYRMQARIMEETIGQSENPLWIERRKYLLTASHVYKVIQKKASSKVDNLVSSILQPAKFQNSNIVTDARSYGLYYEKEARCCYERIMNVKVIETGIIVDVPNGLLGASPDGLIGSDGLLEIKCPFSARYCDKIIDAISNGAIPYLEIVGSKVQLVRNSSYYFQVITQLGISDRKFCDFFVYIPNGTNGLNFYCERINPDNALWALIKMEMERFYHHCLLPEIINSRINRKMPVRGGDFVISKDLQEARKKLGNCVRVKRKYNFSSEVTTPTKIRKVTKRKLEYNCT